MSFLKFLWKAPLQGPEHDLYSVLVRQARTPALYEEMGVPDTPDGRFDMILLHAFLVFRRMKADHARTEALSQRLFDLIFADMETNLREMGIGDVGVPKRIKGMVNAFYGRVAAYEDGLAADEEGPLALALRRNVFRGVPEDAVPNDAQIARLAAYVRAQAGHMETIAMEDLLAGRVAFRDPADVSPPAA